MVLWAESLAPMIPSLGVGLSVVAHRCVGDAVREGALGAYLGTGAAPAGRPALQLDDMSCADAIVLVLLWRRRTVPATPTFSTRTCRRSRTPLRALD